MLRRTTSLDDISQIAENDIFYHSDNDCLYNNQAFYKNKENHPNLQDIMWTCRSYDEISEIIVAIENDYVRVCYLNYLVYMGKHIYDILDNNNARGWLKKTGDTFCKRKPDIGKIKLTKHHYLTLLIDYIYSRSDQTLRLNGCLTINAKTIYHVLKTSISRWFRDSFQNIFGFSDFPDIAQSYRLAYVSSEISRHTGVIPKIIMTSLVLTRYFLDTHPNYVPDISDSEQLQYLCLSTEIGFIEYDIRKIIYEFLEIERTIYIRYMIILSYYLQKHMISDDDTRFMFFSKIESINDMESLLKVMDNPKLSYLLIIALNSCDGII